MIGRKIERTYQGGDLRPVDALHKSADVCLLTGSAEAAVVLATDHLQVVKRPQIVVLGQVDLPLVPGVGVLQQLHWLQLPALSILAGALGAQRPATHTEAEVYHGCVHALLKFIWILVRTFCVVFA